MVAEAGDDSAPGRPPGERADEPSGRPLDTPETPTRGIDGGSRHQARERALSLLYEAEMKGEPAAEVLAALPVPPDPFAAGLVVAAEAARDEAMALIADASEGWPLDRMAVVDRLVLLMAVAELMDRSGPPVAVVIDEAVELAKTYSTDRSGAFVNGVLSTIAEQVRG